LRREPESWIDVGAADELRRKPVQQVLLGRKRIALVYKDGRFSSISGVCNHVGGPLGEGKLDGDYVVCPWHYWKFHCRTGQGEPGFEEDRVPAHEVHVENGRVLINRVPSSKRGRKPHEPHPLARTPRREAGPIRVLGISTTAMTAAHPRYSTSEDLLSHSLQCAVEDLHCESGTSVSGSARATTPSPRVRAPGHARSRRWIRATRWSECTRGSCIGPT